MRFQVICWWSTVNEPHNVAFTMKSADPATLANDRDRQKTTCYCVKYYQQATSTLMHHK